MTTGTSLYQLQRSGLDQFDALATITASPSAPDVEPSDEAEDRIIIGPTYRDQVVMARRGQGVFRSNVLLREDC